MQSSRKKKNQFKKYKHIILFLGSFLTLRRAENLKMSLLKLNLREVQILERTSFGFHRVRIKCHASYRLGGKVLTFYIYIPDHLTICSWKLHQTTSIIKVFDS